MALSALDKIRLGRQLNTLIQDSQAATGLRKITVGRQITALLIQLGYGQKTAQTDANSETAHQTAEDHLPPPANVEKPAIVAAFLNGDFIHQDSSAFTETLTGLERYLNVFLTMDDVVAGASDWLREKHPEAA